MSARLLDTAMAAPTIEKPAQRRSAMIQGVLYAIAMCGTLYGLAWFEDVPFTTPYQVLLAFVAIVGFFGFRRFDLASSWSLADPGSPGRRALSAWLVLVAVVLFGAYASKFSDRLSRALLLQWMVMTPAVLIGLHLLVRSIATRFVPATSMRRSAVIVFVNDTARDLARTLARSTLYSLVGYFDDRPVARTAGGLEGVPLIASTARVADRVRRQGIQVVFVVLPEGAPRRVTEVLDQLGDTTASVYYVPDFLAAGLRQAHIGEVEGIPMMEIVETPFYGVDGVLKQVFDFTFATAALVLLSPLLLAIAVAVKLDSPGPVLFRQRRYGLDGRPFHVLKFRTMRTGAADQDRQATRDDPRVTRVGRFLRRSSFDELPQFWNVLRGEMSVVGPRPHTVGHTEYYRRAVKHYMVRHKVKPGITGWAQVHGLRGETAQIERMAERVRHDIDYVRHWSPLLDLEIIARTVLVLLRDDQAY